MMGISEVYGGAAKSSRIPFSLSLSLSLSLWKLFRFARVCPITTRTCTRDFNPRKTSRPSASPLRVIYAREKYEKILPARRGHLRPSFRSFDRP